MTSRKSRVTFRVALCVLSILGIGTGAREVPAQAETTTRLQMPLWTKRGSKPPGAKPDVRVDGALRAIAREFDGWKAARSQQAPAADFRPRHPLAPVGGGGAVSSCSSGRSPSGPSAAPPPPQPTSTSCC